MQQIASENLTSASVMECLGSCLTNKYSEGEVGHRYYGGNEIIDKVWSALLRHSTPWLPSSLPAPSCRLPLKLWS